MSILSDSAILRAISDELIKIQPFDSRDLGGNSYDVHLAPRLLVYRRALAWLNTDGLVHPAHPDDDPLDCKVEEETREIVIPEQGYVLQPNILYLAATIEYTETLAHVPYLDGKSSIGRLGIFIHTTAGRGDVGFRGHWTMEISVIHPVRVYAGMPIGQLTFHNVEGEVRSRYDTKLSQKYTEAGWSPDPWPVASRMFRNFK